MSSNEIDNVRRTYAHLGNQFARTVKKIIRGPVLSEVDVETAAGIVTSVITTRSIDSLDRRVGTEVLAIFKSTEVMIAKVV